MYQKVHFNVEISRVFCRMHKDLEGTLYNYNISSVDSGSHYVESKHSLDCKVQNHFPPKIMEHFHSFISESFEEADDQPFELEHNIENDDGSPTVTLLQRGRSQTELNFMLQMLPEKEQSRDDINQSKISFKADSPIIPNEHYHDHHEHLTVRCIPNPGCCASSTMRKIGLKQPA